jgi:hypothetical protein
VVRIKGSNPFIVLEKVMIRMLISGMIITITNRGGIVEKSLKKPERARIEIKAPHTSRAAIARVKIFF